MAASSQVSTNAVDELLFQNDSVSLCLLVNRRHRTLRVIDFRAGPTVAKRDFVIATAKREGVEKVFTLVERDEVPTWTRLGFTREGSIPSFYKRSDAWILGAVVSQVGPIRAESEFDEDEIDEDPADGSNTPAAATAERTIARAKRQVKEALDKPLPSVKMAPARPDQVQKAVVAAQKAGRALTGFEPFGRDAERTHCVLTAKGGFELHASWEVQHCFGNSFFEMLTGPRSESERQATIAAITTLCDRLVSEGAVSTFTIAPADDTLLATAFLACGFRRSAVLARHLMVGGDRKDGIVWSKKLSTPEA